MKFTEYLTEYKNYKTPYLIMESSAVNKHLDHLDEIILIDKESGLQRGLQLVMDLRDIFNGAGNKKVFTTVKYDGAPAIIFGIDKDSDQFFVSTKSLANKTPKINYTEADIEENHGHAPGLVAKLKYALKYLPQVMKSKDIYQADIMFTKDDVYTTEYDGEKMVAFKPNTIVYMFPTTSQEAREIVNAEIGIVVHTKYAGSARNITSTSFDVNKDEFNDAIDVWLQSAKFTDATGTVTLTEDEERYIELLVSLLQNTQLDWNDIPDDIYNTIKIFGNRLIRSGQFFDNPSEDFQQYLQYINGMFQKQIDKLKSPAGKERKQTERDKFIQSVEINENNILTLFKTMKLFKEVKDIFISKYNASIISRQFLQDENGDLVVTNPEGYVAVDRKGNAVKLVDRLEFSRANFSNPKEVKFK